MVTMEKKTNRQLALEAVEEAKRILAMAEESVGVASFNDALIDFLNSNVDSIELPDNLEKNISFRGTYNLEYGMFEADYTVPGKRSGSGTRVVMDWTPVKLVSPGSSQESAFNLPMSGEKTPNWDKAIEDFGLPSEVKTAGSSIKKIEYLESKGYKVLLEGEIPDDETEENDENDSEKSEPELVEAIA